MDVKTVNVNEVLMVAILRTNAKFPEMVKNRTNKEISQLCNEYADLIEAQSREAELGRKIFNVFHNSVECKGKDCPIKGYIDDCEDCPFSKVCDMVIDLENLRIGNT